MPGSQTIQSVERALDAMERIAQSPQGVTLTALAGSLGLKPPTAHAILRTLVGRSYVRRLDKPARYVLGPAAAALNAAGAPLAWRQAAQDAMARLARQLPKATMVLVEAVGGELVTTRRMCPEQPGVVLRPTHMVMSPYSSASDLAFLAFASPEAAASHRRRYPFAEYGAHQWHGQAALETFLQGARRLGYALPTDESFLFRVAAPLVSPNGELLALLGVSAPKAGMTALTMKALVARLLAATSAVDRSLQRTTQELT